MNRAQSNAKKAEAAIRRYHQTSSSNKRSRKSAAASDSKPAKGDAVNNESQSHLHVFTQDDAGCSDGPVSAHDEGRSEELSRFETNEAAAAVERTDDQSNIGSTLKTIIQELRSLKKEVARLSASMAEFKSTVTRDSFNKDRFRIWLQSSFPKMLDHIVESKPSFKALKDLIDRTDHDASSIAQIDEMLRVLKAKKAIGSSKTPLRKDFLRILKECWQILPYRVDVFHPNALLEANVGISYGEVQNFVAAAIHQHLFTTTNPQIVTMPTIQDVVAEIRSQHNNQRRNRIKSMSVADAYGDGAELKAEGTNGCAMLDCHTDDDADAASQSSESSVHESVREK